MSETTHTLRSGATVTLCEPHQVAEKYVRRARNKFGELSEEGRQAVVEARAMAPDKKLSPAAKAELEEQLALKIMNAMAPADREIIDEGNDLAAVALIVGWSFDPFDGKHPTPDDLVELPSGDYREIQELAAGPAAKLLEGEDFDPDPDPESPSKPSGD